MREYIQAVLDREFYIPLDHKKKVSVLKGTRTISTQQLNTELRVAWWIDLVL